MKKKYSHVFEVLHCPVDDFSLQFVRLDVVVAMFDGHKIIITVRIEKVLKKFIHVTDDGDLVRRVHPGRRRSRHLSQHCRRPSCVRSFLKVTFQSVAEAVLVCFATALLLSNWVWQQQRGIFN